MSEPKLTVEQKIQIARMATDIVQARTNIKASAFYFTDEHSIRNDHDLFLFAYKMIEKKITSESDTD